MNTPAVAVFIGCSFNYYFPQVAQAALSVLTANNFKVYFPEQVCCGLPMLGKGNIKGVRHNIARNTRSLREVIDAGASVITLCPSCHLFLTHHAIEIGGLEEQKIARATHFYSRFLVNLLSQEQLKMRLKSLPHTVFYQTPCHLTACTTGQPSVALLRLIPELSIKHISTSCCGMAGMWGYQKTNFDLSRAISSDLFSKLREHPADYTVTDCGSCRLQIQGVTGITVDHPIELLRHSMAPQALPVSQPETRHE